MFDGLKNAKKRYKKMKIKYLNTTSKNVIFEDGLFKAEILGPINIGTKTSPAYAAIGNAGKIRNGNTLFH